MNNQFDWYLIRAFLAALDAGSLLGAAKQLQTTQPTVGRQVAQLEAQMGVVLFERTGRGLQPTATALSLATPRAWLCARSALIWQSRKTSKPVTLRVP